MIYPRYLEEQIKGWLFKGKVIILYGPRQVGKTTLIKKILSDQKDSLYLNCELYRVKQVLESENLERIKAYLSGYQFVVLDEAQKINDIGLLLKILVDSLPDKQFIATGSSSFELSGKISEPLTGRNIKFIMYPISISEYASVHNPFEMDEKLNEMITYGMYPDLIDRGLNEKADLLDTLTSDYLFRDIFQLERIKQPDLLVNLLKAIGLQLGNEVSLRELSILLKTSVETIQRYLELLEKSFVLFHLKSFSRNLRNELSRSRKYYFYDTGVRNSLLQNYNHMENRTDAGALWENFCVAERLKYLREHKNRGNLYFWRTYQQKEIDLVEESGGHLKAFEFKWNPKANVKKPQEFFKTYSNSTYHIVHRENYKDFLMNPVSGVGQ